MIITLLHNGTQVAARDETEAMRHMTPEEREAHVQAVTAEMAKDADIPPVGPVRQLKPGEYLSTAAS